MRGRAVAARSVRGLTLVEVVVAAGITMTLSAALLIFVRMAAAAIRTQPERADVQQRLRTTVDGLALRLENAGAGPAAGGGSVPMARRVPVVFPQRRGPGGDPPLAAFADRFTVYTTPEGASLAALAQDMATVTAPIVLASSPGCPLSTPTCRFTVGDTALLFDATGAHDIITVAAVGPSALDHVAAVSRPYRTALGAAVAVVEVRSVFLDTARNQLRITSPAGMNQPLADNVTDFELTFYGAPDPPDAPRPPPGEDGCVIDVAGGPKLPGLQANWGSLVALPPRSLSDGPVCGSGAAGFDVDLFRVRQVRFRLRAQAGDASYRGVVARWFRRPGPATDVRMMVPDQEVTRDVTLTNLRAGR